MIEPRNHLHLLRRDSPTDQSEPAELEERLIEHDEPDRPIHPGLEFETQTAEPVPEDENRPEESLTKRRLTIKDLRLLLSFIALIISGTGHVLAAKLQAIPMFNYPNFLNLYAIFMYIPICFAYIIPAARYGWFKNAITDEHLALPKRPFAIMGALDCLATTMQVFSSVYLPGPLLVLLPQCAIPLSIFLSRSLLGERYTGAQYLGASIVLVGVLVVLEPVFTHRRSPNYYCEAINVENDCTICQVEISRQSCVAHSTADERPAWLASWNDTIPADDDLRICRWLPFDESSQEKELLVFVWSLIMIASCVPMTLSSTYKQIALAENMDLDPIFLNGWIAIFQFFFSILVAVPAAMFASPAVQPFDVVNNLWGGLQCYMGQGSVTTGCHPDALCSFHAALLVNVCLFCNVTYSFVMMLVLKYGSSALLFLALTIMVPMGNLAFALPFMPQSTPVHPSDLFALAVILSGLVLYRFSDTPFDGTSEHDENSSPSSLKESQHFPPYTWPHHMHTLREPLIQTGDV